ncbi:MAG: ATP-binding protein, partial [Candidatus Pacebacteria bacterium]|nr:ATP-binding protein [Candidatus Paceibacterota bacterium]
MFNTEHLQEKWQPVLEHPDLPEIKDAYKRAVTTVILENQERSMQEDKSFLSEAAPTNAMGASSSTAGAGNIDTWDPILISLIRRAMPNLIAYDICGVQPMSGPTGLIFAMKSHYQSQTGGEALFNEADTDFAGTGTHASSDVLEDTSSYTTGAGMTTA